MNLNEFKDKKIALVLSGGVVKAAAWHLGVAMALEEKGLTFKHNESKKSSYEISTYVGSSAGSFIGAFLAAGFEPRDFVESTLKLTKNNNSKLRSLKYTDIFSLKRNYSVAGKSDMYHPFDNFPLGIKSLLKPLLSINGLFSTSGIHDYMTREILKDKPNFSDYKADLFIVTSQLDFSRKVIFGKYNYPHASHDNTAYYKTNTSIADAAAASMSVPPFFAPYAIMDPETNNYDYYIDGEIRETLSTHVAEDNDCDIIISSWTHTPYQFHDEIGSLVNYGLPFIGLQAIYLMIQKKILTARANKATAYDVIETVNDYLLLEKFPAKHRKNLISILEKKLHIKKNIKYIDIYPDSNDYKLFFANAFTLNTDVTSYFVKAGYDRTMKAFEQS